MSKVKITANGIMQIIQGIMRDEDINVTINDPSAPAFNGKTVEEALNVEYYTFKHRPVSSQKIIEDRIKEGKEANMLYGLSRSFCLVSIGGMERLYSKDVDMITVTATMEYWIQTYKIQLLENLIEDCNLATCGIRIPVQFGEETRQAVIVFGGVDAVDIQPHTSFGEMSICEVSVSILLYPDVVSYSNYTVKFTWMNGETEDEATMPLSSLSYVSTMAQKAVPRAADVRMTGSINLSRAITFALVFDGHNNDFVNYITARALSVDDENDNNQSYLMEITRKGVASTHEVVIKDHQVTVNADTGNETHKLTLVQGGL